MGGTRDLPDSRVPLVPFCTDYPSETPVSHTVGGSTTGVDGTPLHDPSEPKPGSRSVVGADGESQVPSTDPSSTHRVPRSQTGRDPPPTRPIPFIERKGRTTSFFSGEIGSLTRATRARVMRDVEYTPPPRSGKPQSVTEIPGPCQTRERTQNPSPPLADPQPPEDPGPVTSPVRAPFRSQPPTPTLLLPLCRGGVFGPGTSRTTWGLGVVPLIPPVAPSTRRTFSTYLTVSVGSRVSHTRCPSTPNPPGPDGASDQCSTTYGTSCRVRVHISMMVGTRRLDD